MKRHSGFAVGVSISFCMAALLMAGCQSSVDRSQSAGPATQPVAPVAKAPAVALPTIRINAGADAPLKDSKGVEWSADTGYDGGDTVDRPDLNVTGTPTPELYHTEHYSMNFYTLKVPNGDYVLKLHFSEDYEGIGSPDDRRFTYAVRDGTSTGKVIKEVPNFSPWQAAGGQYKAYVDTIPVTVTTGQITITFTPQIENPQINALELIPR